MNKPLILNKPLISAILVVVCFAFSANMMAKKISRDDYQLVKNNIASEYRLARTGCGSVAGNARDVCLSEIAGKQSETNAELDVLYKPSISTRREAGITKAKAQLDTSQPDHSPLEAIATDESTSTMIRMYYE